MDFRYGNFTQDQIAETKEKMRKQIFFLLLIADPVNAEEYDNVDINEAIESLLKEFGGLNDLLNYPQELVDVLALISAAKLEYNSPNYNWRRYRKLILDAGNKVLKIKEV